MAEDFTNKLGDAAEKAQGFSNVVDRLSISIGSMVGLQKDQIEATMKSNKLQAQLEREKKKSVPLQKKMTIQLQQRLKNSTLLNKGLKETIKSMNLFGKTMSGLKGALGGIGKGIAAIGKAGVIGGLVVGVKFLIDGLLKVDAAMATLAKRLGSTRESLKGVRDVSIAVQMELGGFGINLEKATTEAANLALQFGSIGYVTKDLVVRSLKLQMAFGLSAQASGELLESLVRNNIEVETFVTNIGKKSQAAGVLTNLVMKDLASSSQMIAIQSSRGVESMQNLAVEAAKAGGSLKDFAGLESTYSDVEKASAAIGRATTLMGSDIAKHMGNIQDLRMMYERGETDKILERVQKATAATVKLNKEGNLVNMKGRELYRSEVKAMAELAGMEEAAYKLMAKAHLEEKDFNALVSKEKLGMISKSEKARLAEMRDRKKAVQIQQDELDIIRSQQTILEKLGNIASGVFDRISTAFSDVLGVDSDAPGSVRATIDELGKQVEEIFDFPNLKGDIEQLGGGFTGLFEALKQRFSTFGDAIFTSLKDGFSRAITWFQENYEFSILDGGFVKSDQGIANEQKDRQENLKKQQENQARLETNRDRLIASRQSEIAKIKEQAENDKFIAIQEAKLIEDKDKREAAILAAETNAFDKVGEFLRQSREKETSFNKQIKESVELQEEISKSIYDNEIAATTAAVNANRKRQMEGNRALNALDYVIPDFLYRRQEVGRDYFDRIADRDPAGRDYGLPTKSQALGGVHRRGTAALVGEERRGEVVVSRSALRSGIGVGGRAAKALASIGVPGFFRGEMVGGVTGRQGLMTGFGSEASRGAQAAAYQKEQAIQQAAMVNYWREYYENKRDNMDRSGPKKDDSKFLKDFFLQNRKDLKLVSDIMLKNQHSAAKETNEAVFAAMTAWSKGAKSGEALKLGVRVGMAESMKPGGTMYNMFDKTNKLLQEQIKSGTKTQAAIAMGMQSMSLGLQSAMATYAQTGDMKAAKEQMKRTAVSGGVTMLATRMFGEDAMTLAKQVRSGQVPKAAKGKYVNSPTLMMVGEEGRGEVVIPTERIRKGLPINAGVAAELASIGVPGFFDGGKTDPRSGTKAKSSGMSSALDSILGGDVAAAKAAGFNPGKSKSAYELGDKDFMGGAKASGAAAALSFAQVYMQTGNMRLAAQAGLEAGVSMAATALLSIPPSNPMIGSILGPIVGSTVAGPLGKSLGITGGQGKARRRTLKGIESHVKSGGLFDFGQPSGLRKNISVAVGGKENVPTEENYNKLVQKVSSSQVLKPLWAAGIDPSVIVAAASGKLKGPKAFNSFKAINEALYGSAGGDKYMKAVAVPQLATGGIVTKPTTAVVGEAGPEMVIPLTEQRQSNDNMIKELKEQNKLMREMIKTQQETGKTEVRLDGRVIAQSTAENFYDIGSGI